MIPDLFDRYAYLKDKTNKSFYTYNPIIEKDDLLSSDENIKNGFYYYKNGPNIVLVINKCFLFIESNEDFKRNNLPKKEKIAFAYYYDEEGKKEIEKLKKFNIIHHCYELAEELSLRKIKDNIE